MYRRQASALHTVRVSVACFWVATLAIATFVIASPWLLAVELAAVLLAAWFSGVLGRLKKIVLFGLFFAFFWGMVNMVFSHEGLTVLVRGVELPVLGQMDITLEAATYGLREGLRVLVVIAIFGLYSLCVDPDQILKIARKVSFGSALTAAVATRMVPVLAGDAKRMSAAMRARGSGRIGKRLVVHALAAGALERSTDVAATLELRGYALRGRPQLKHRPFSRHDIAFLLSGLGLVALTTVAAIYGWFEFEFYPQLRGPAPAQQLLAATTLLLLTVLPCLGRKGVGIIDA